MQTIPAHACTHTHTYTHTLGNPPNKKRKIEKKSRAEKAMERAMESFVKYQTEAAEIFKKDEEERWKKECELEEKRRQEDKQHEIRMMQMLGHMFGSYQHHTGPYDDSNYYQ